MGFMRDIMQDRATVLEADGWFNDIPVLTTRLGALDFLIDAATNKLGTCVVLWAPSLAVEALEIDKVFGLLSVTGSIFEQVEINQAAEGTRKFAEDTAEAVAGLWMIHKVPAGYENAFYPLSPTIQPVPDPDFVRYDVRFGIKAGYKFEESSAIQAGNTVDILTGAGIPILKGESPISAD
jgi:hypothetical protein